MVDLKDGIKPDITPDKGWYRPDDGLEDSYNGPDAEYPKGHPSNQTLSDSDLSEAESGFSEPDETKDNKATSSEKDSLGVNDDDESDDSNLNFTGKNSKKNKGILSGRKKGIGGVLVAILVSAVMGLSTQAPNFIINTLRSMVTDRMSLVQDHHMKRYRRSRIGKIRNLFSKDGRLGNKMLTEMETRGYKFSVDSKGKFAGMELPDGTRITDFTAASEHMDDYLTKTRPLVSTSKWKTKRMNAFYSLNKVTRESLVKKTDGSDPDPKKELNKRAASDILEGDDIKIDSKNPDGNANETDAEREVREKASADLDDITNETGVFREAKEDILKNGESYDKALKNVGLEGGEEAASGFVTGATKEALDAATEYASSGSIGSKVGSGLKSFLNPTDILDRVCTVKNTLRAATTASRLYKQRALIRAVSSLVLSTSDGTRIGNRFTKNDTKLLGEVMKQFTSADRNGNYLGGSPGIRYAASGVFNKKAKAQKPLYGVDGKLEGTWKGIQEATDQIPGTGPSSCGVIQNPFFQVGSGIAVTGGKAIICVFTVGIGCGAAQLGETALQETVQVTVTGLIKTSIQNSIRSILTKKVLAEVAIGVALDFGFDAAMALVKLHVEQQLALPVTGQEKGAEIGSLVTAGGGSLSKQRALLAGQVPATTEQYASAHQTYLAERKQELGEMGLWDRYANINNMDSLASKLAVQATFNSGGTIQGTTSTLASFAVSVPGLNILSSSFSNIIGGSASADDGDDVAFDEYVLESGPKKGTGLATDFAGNPQVIMRSDIASVDPDKNIDSLVASNDIDSNTFQPKSDSFKNHIANCIDNIDTISGIEFNQDSSSPDKDCLAENAKTVKFKAHLAYIDMVDGLEAEFLPEDISEQTTTTQETNPIPELITTPQGSGPIDISQTSLIPGTDNTRIATSVLPQFSAMLEKAKSDGVNLLPISSGWRDPQKQIALRKQNCPDWQTSPASACSPPTAKPGTSNHESGQAIDFGNMCFSPNGSTSCPGNKRWEWLKANAGNFGFKPLSSEAWHWSTTGR
ncbi:M15 family metallopeptidase [Candidatus Saccharibacteria bacterium]|nr:M15 family metallopeptidase [Candidatus Saccharibacteria bacterium]